MKWRSQSRRFVLVVADAVEDDEVLERLDPRVDDLHEGAHASAVLRLLREERRLGIQLLEQLDDRGRLDVLHAVDHEARQVPHRVRLLVLVLALLALEQVHVDGVVGEPLVAERDADAVRSGRTPVRVEREVGHDGGQLTRCAGSREPRPAASRPCRHQGIPVKPAHATERDDGRRLERGRARDARRAATAMTAHRSLTSGALARVVLRGTTIVLAASLVVTLAWAVMTVAARPLDGVEGDVFFEANRIRAGLALYTDPRHGANEYGPPPARYLVLYPPLWSAALSLLPRAAAPIAGRVLASAAWLGVIGFLISAGSEGAATCRRHSRRLRRRDLGARALRRKRTPRRGRRPRVGPRPRARSASGNGAWEDDAARPAIDSTSCPASSSRSRRGRSRTSSEPRPAPSSHVSS